jgi:hypothetical protein
MQTGLIENTTNQSTHSKESILLFLDSDKSDTRRKSFIDVLLQSPETQDLLYLAFLDWLEKITQQHVTIFTLEEFIRIYKGIIDLQKTKPHCYDFKAEDNIKETEKIIKAYEKELDKEQSALSQSLDYAMKSLLTANASFSKEASRYKPG